RLHAGFARSVRPVSSRTPLGRLATSRRLHRTALHAASERMSPEMTMHGLSDTRVLLRVERELGIVATSHVASWADQMIAALPQVLEALLELSAAATSNP